MEGCSDFTWDVGRTLVVRNRCDAVVVLEQRALGSGVSWGEAVLSVARRLLASSNIAQVEQPNASLKHAPFRGIQDFFDSIRRAARFDLAEMVRGLDACARGRFSKQDRLAMQLVTLNVLDYVCAATL
eukprot:200527-Prymnesium_polylepis.1